MKKLGTILGLPPEPTMEELKEAIKRLAEKAERRRSWPGPCPKCDGPRRWKGKPRARCPGCEEKR